jgi:transposase
MMGERTGAQEALFYGFSLEGYVPPDQMLRSIDRFVDLGDIRERLKPFYSDTGRPSIDLELMLRMLIVGYGMGIRSERRLCDEVHLNLAYRWFCRLGLDGAVPDHSTFSKNRHGRFRDSDVLRQLFEATVSACMAAGLVGGEAFAVDASMIRADANRKNGHDKGNRTPTTGTPAVRAYLATLDDADGFIRYRATKLDGDACALKPKCCPVAPARKIMRSIHEEARDIARAIATTDAFLVPHRQRKRV